MQKFDLGAKWQSVYSNNIGGLLAFCKIINGKREREKTLIAFCSTLKAFDFMFALHSRYFFTY